MKFSNTLKSFCLLLFILSCSHENGGTVSGIVRDPYLSRPLKDIRVTLQGIGKSTLSDSLGQFQFHKIPRGTYRIELLDSSSRYSRGYDFADSLRVVVTNDSISTVSVVALKSEDMIRSHLPFHLPFLVKGRLFSGSFWRDWHGIPLAPERLIIEDTAKRLVNTLNDLEGYVAITKERQSLQYVRLLTEDDLEFEHNDLGAGYYEASAKGKRGLWGWTGIAKSDFERLGLHEPTVTAVLDSVSRGKFYVIDRFVYGLDSLSYTSRSCAVYRVKESVSPNGGYKLIEKIVVGRSNQVGIPIRY